MDNTEELHAQIRNLIQEPGIYSESAINRLYTNVLEKGEMLVIQDTRLIKLPNILQKFSWLKTIKIMNTGLIEIGNIPENAENVFLQRNKINTVSNITDFNKIKRLSLKDNKLDIIDFSLLPQSIEQLDVSDNIIHTVVNSTHLQNMNTLVINNNKLTQIPQLNSSILRLSFAKNKLESLKGCSDNIMELDCSNCNLSNLDHLPEKQLIKLIAYSNKFKCLTKMKHMHLKHLDVSYNGITNITDIPETLEELDISHNDMTNITFEIPATLTDFDTRGNNLTKETISKITQQHKHIHSFMYDDNDDDDNFDSLDDMSIFSDIQSSHHSQQWRPQASEQSQHHMRFLQFMQQHQQQVRQQDTTPQYMKQASDNPYHIVSKKTIKMSRRV